MHAKRLLSLSAITYAFASVEPALVLPVLFTELYHFDSVRNG